MKILPTIAAVLLLWLSHTTYADTQWSTSNIQFLASSQYDNLNNETFTGNLITYEHAAGYDWGKTFFFIDHLQDTDTEAFDETYTELGIDFSISQWIDTDLSYGYLQDVYLATQYEYSNVNGLNNYLIGIGTSWKVEGFAFLNANFYHRNNTSNSYFPQGPVKGNNYQLTVAWSYPFNIGETQWYFDGFFDYETPAYYGASETKFDLIKFQPQLKMDIGQYYGDKGTVLVGIELDYMHNKFGVEGANQLAPQFLLQIIF